MVRGRKRLRLLALEQVLHLHVEIQAIGEPFGKGQAAVKQYTYRALPCFQQKAHKVAAFFREGKLLLAAEIRIGFGLGAQHEARRLGAGKGQDMLAKIAVVDRDARKVAAGVAEVFLADADEDVAEHVAVPERTSAVLRLKDALVVFVGDELAPELVAQLTRDGLIEPLGLAVDIDVPMRFETPWKRLSISST